MTRNCNITVPLCSVVNCLYHLEGSSIAKQTGLSVVGKIPSENITIYRLGRHCIILSKPELVSSCILYELVAGATMCVLTLSCLQLRGFIHADAVLWQ